MSAPPLTPLAAAALAVGTPESVLCVECGEGDGALFLAREFPRARVRGCDSDPEAVRRAAARVGLDPEGRVAFKLGPPGDLPFPDDHFDLVALVDSRPRPAELARVLRPGGRLLVAATGPGRVDQGIGARLADWRLRRRGFEPERAEAAGDGSFSVARLRDRGPAARPF